MDINLKLATLKAYLDRSYICSLLCELHYNWYYKLNAIFLFPMAIGSVFLTILNTSSLNDEIMKYINISINGINCLTVAITTNYKINERVAIYKSSQIKYQKLLHKIEAFVNGCSEISNIDLDNLINEYDSIGNDIPFGYLESYKKLIANKYGNKRILPNSLQLQVEDNNICSLVNLNSNV